MVINVGKETRYLPTIGMNAKKTKEIRPIQMNAYPEADKYLLITLILIKRQKTYFLVK